MALELKQATRHGVADQPELIRFFEIDPATGKLVQVKDPRKPA